MIRIFLFLSFLLIVPNIYSNNFKAEITAVLTKDDAGKNFKFPTLLYFNRTTNNLYIIDSPRKKINVYNENLFPFFSAGKGRGIDSPDAITSNNGEIFILQNSSVAGSNNGKISVFSKAWIKKKDIMLHWLSEQKYKNIFIKTIVLNKNRIYIAGTGFKEILVLTLQGKIIKEIKVKDALSKTAKKQYISFNKLLIYKNKLYALSADMGKVYVFSQNGKFIFKFGEKGGVQGKMSRPRGFATDKKNDLLYIVDYMRQTVLVFNANTGKYIFEFGGFGSSPGYFNYPNDIAVDNKGNVYVVDMFNKRVEVFKIEKNKKSVKN